MKALIRNPNETILETDGVPGINWDTGYPLTEPGWSGGPYTLVQNYVPPVNDEPAQYEEVVVEPEQVVIEDEDNYVIIDGKRYSKAELRSLIE